MRRRKFAVTHSISEASRQHQLRSKNRDIRTEMEARTLAELVRKVHEYGLTGESWPTVKVTLTRYVGDKWVDLEDGAKAEPSDIWYIHASVVCQVPG